MWCTNSSFPNVFKFQKKHGIDLDLELNDLKKIKNRIKACAQEKKTRLRDIKTAPCNASNGKY